MADLRVPFLETLRQSALAPGPALVSSVRACRHECAALPQIRSGIGGEGAAVRRAGRPAQGRPRGR
jgi:hypothetical protein